MVNKPNFILACFSVKNKYYLCILQDMRREYSFLPLHRDAVMRLLVQTSFLRPVDESSLFSSILYSITRNIYMITRRDFFKKSGILAAGVAVSTFPGIASQVNPSKVLSYVSQRPELGERGFVSKAVEATIVKVKKQLKDPKLSWMFENCFPNTLDTTVRFKMENGKPDTFVITGDIHAMWLRDSTAQVWPYLPLMIEDKELQQMVRGLVYRQTKCINIDSYANAFNDGPSGSEWESDFTDMKPELHERKWEIDSLCYPIRLAYNYWKMTGDASVFDAEWIKAMETVVKTFKEQQRKDSLGPYKFQRVTAHPTDSLMNKGYGSPVNGVGLIVSSFRPSDDASTFGFLIPSNMFAVVSLRQLSEISKAVTKHDTFADECSQLADEVDAAIRTYGVVEREGFGKVYAFEVDGFGNSLTMDDANIPSLISIPYLGYAGIDDPIYQNTRKLIWSKANPYFFEGKFAAGIGGPHVGLGYVWPMSFIMKAMTSNDPKEVEACITTLRDTDADTGFMHESFNVNDPNDFTRKWFAWVNTLFGELILKTLKEHPAILT